MTITLGIVSISFTIVTHYRPVELIIVKMIFLKTNSVI